MPEAATLTALSERNSGLAALLAELAGEQVVYMAVPGNGGDALIAAATYQVLGAYGITLELLDSPQALRDRTVLIAACSMATARSWRAARRRPPASRSRSHHVDLLNRGCCRGGGEAILVPALCDEGSRLIRALIERAASAKCSALVLTVDLQVLGQRHCDIQNGMTAPPQIKLANLIDMASKPAWALSILRGKRKTFGNLAGHIPGMENVTSVAEWTSTQFDPALS